LWLGRTPEKLKVAEKKRFKTFSVDMSNPASIHALAEKVTQEFPNLNVVIHNAGIAKAENLFRAETRRSKRKLF
jgi:short-subunit dehydrogenase involved in D-alanine esterification of teichoic acids